MDMGSECGASLRLQGGRQEVNSEGFKFTVGFANCFYPGRAAGGLQWKKESLAARDL